jgi:ribonuclease P protein component
LNFTYNKSEKLKSKKTIERLFVEGKVISAYPLRLVYLKTDEPHKIGVSVSKRNFKKAVDRIRIKRLLREGYRLNKNELKNNTTTSYAFMILYLSKDMPDFELIQTKTRVLFSKFLQKVEPKETDLKK